MGEEKIIENLLIKYKDNEDATETILRARKDLEYIRSRNEGQTPEQYIRALEGVLEMWF